jgi:hypothetical protein
MSRAILLETLFILIVVLRIECTKINEGGAGRQERVQPTEGTKVPQCDEMQKRNGISGDLVIARDGVIGD